MRLVYLYLVLLSFLFARKGNGLPPPQFVFANEANAISDYGSPSSIITGIYGIGKNSPKIAVHTPDGLEEWSWDWASDDVQKANTHMKSFPDISQCISKYWSNWKSATDVKFTREQDLIAAIYSDAAVVFKHAPDNKEIDKKIVFAVCLYGGLRHAHTIEFVRGNKLAISTTGPSASDGFWVYDLNAPLTNSPQPIQKMAGLPAIHGLIWDEHDGVLWANGNDKSPQGDQYHPSRGILQGYPVNHTTGQFIEDIGLRFEFPEANPMDIEWPGWWEGPHEIATVPNERKFLVTTDLDLYSFDLNLRRFERGLSVQQQYINGFVPVDCRTGVNPQNLEKWLPRSGIKGLSLAPNGDFLYIQAPWRDSESLGKQLNVVRGGGGEKSKPYKGLTVYRSHWFVDIPGWPKAKN